MTHMCLALAMGWFGGYEDGEAPPGKPMSEVEADPGDWIMPPAEVTVVSRLAVSGLMSSGL